MRREVRTGVCPPIGTLRFGSAEECRPKDLQESSVLTPSIRRYVALVAQGEIFHTVQPAVRHSPVAQEVHSEHRRSGEGRRIITSSAAIVTVWFVTITGRMLAYQEGKRVYCAHITIVNTWLLVIEENRKIAEGSDRKNA